MNSEVKIKYLYFFKMKSKYIILSLFIMILILIIYYFRNRNENYRPLNNLKTYMKNNSTDLDKHYLCYYYNLNNHKTKNPVKPDEDISKSTQEKLNELCKQKNNLQILEEIKKYSDENPVNCNSSDAYGLWNNNKQKTRDSYFKWNSILSNKYGCYTRDKVLERDSVPNTVIYDNTVWSSPCTIKSGEWKIPTEDNRILMHPNDLDVDHHVPLKNAFISGACLWDKKLKYPVTYANDMTPGHLKAISLQMNRSKNDNSPDEWMPYKYREHKLDIPQNITEEDCKYAADWIAVKQRYGLNITEPEYDELKKILSENICQTIKPSYPILENDNPKSSLDIIDIDQRILTFPLLETKALDNNDYYKNQWSELCGKNASKKSRQTLNRESLYNDIINNYDSFGIYNLNYIKDNYKDDVNILCDIINSKID